MKISGFRLGKTAPNRSPKASRLNPVGGESTAAVLLRIDEVPIHLVEAGEEPADFERGNDVALALAGLPRERLRGRSRVRGGQREDKDGGRERVAHGGSVSKGSLCLRALGFSCP